VSPSPPPLAASGFVTDSEFLQKLTKATFALFILGVNDKFSLFIIVLLPTLDFIPPPFT